MNSNELLDAVKNRLALPSDYALARDVFHVRQISVTSMRARGLSDERAVQCAKILDLDEGLVLAWVSAERAKNPEVKKSWERAANIIRSAAATLAAVSFLGFFSPTDVHASVGSSFNITQNAIYIMRTRLWMWPVGFPLV